MTVIKKAKVPLVKFVHVSTGVQVDVCFNQPSGMKSGQAAKELMSQMQPVREQALGASCTNKSTSGPKYFTPRTDDLYDLFPLDDLDLPDRADRFLICIICMICMI